MHNMHAVQKGQNIPKIQPVWSFGHMQLNILKSYLVLLASLEMCALN